MRIKKLLPYLILLLIVIVSYILYKSIEGFTTPICTCPTGYTAGTSTNSDKCYKTGFPTVFKDCKCSNTAIVPHCSDGKKAANNKCYNCDPSYPTYNTPTLMTISPYVGTVRCTTSGLGTAASKMAYEVTNGLFCSS